MKPKAIPAIAREIPLRAFIRGSKGFRPEPSLGFSPGLGARQLPTDQGKRVATAFHITSPVLK